MRKHPLTCDSAGVGQTLLPLAECRQVWEGKTLFVLMLASSCDYAIIMVRFSGTRLWRQIRLLISLIR